MRRSTGIPAKQMPAKKVPNMGGWGGPKLFVKFINHWFYGTFDHSIWLKDHLFLSNIFGKFTFRVPNLWGRPIGPHVSNFVPNKTFSF